MSESKEEQRKRFIREQVEKFRREMAEKGVPIETNIDDDNSEFEKFRNDVLTRARRVLSDAEIESLGGGADYNSIKSIGSKSIEREKWLENHDDEGEDPVGRGGAGNIPLKNVTSHTEGYDSYEEMIDDLHAMENSSNPEAKEYAKKVLDELFRKTSEAIKNKELQSGLDYEEKEGESIVSGYKKKSKEKAKQAMGV